MVKLPVQTLPFVCERKLQGWVTFLDFMSSFKHGKSDWAIHPSKPPLSSPFSPFIFSGAAGDDTIHQSRLFFLS